MEKFKIKKIIKPAVYFVMLLVAAKCASQIPPSGGEVDMIPPVVESHYPLNGTTNYTENYFEINFSEYVDKRSVKEAIFISPALEKGIDLDWSGTSLTVYFIDSLKKNTTYNISIGSDVKDLNNSNNMAEAFNFAFSTGNKIDKGIVEGNVYDNNPNGIMIFAYKKSGDSFPDPLNDKPGNITQVGKKGNYKILGLSSGDYRIFAVRDDFKDFIYNIEDDHYAAPSEIVSISDSSLLFSNLDFMMTCEDTTLPHVYNITMTDSYHIMIEFSEYVDSSKLSADNFYIFDSTANKKFETKHLYKGEAKAKNIFIVIDDLLNIENENILFVKDLHDNFGNVLSEEATKFTASDRPDTTAPKLIKQITEYDNSSADFENVYVEFIFNDAFNVESLKDITKIYDLKNNSYPTEIIKNDDASFIVKAKTKLSEKSEYQIKIDLNKIKDAAGNYIDSIYTYKFSTINSLQFSGASGKINTGYDSKLVYVELKNIDIKKKNYKQAVNNNYEFNFERVVPGQYLVWSFYDADSSGNYSYGSINPFEKSEEFIYYPDTLNLKARWPVGDIYINY